MTGEACGRDKAEMLFAGEAYITNEVEAEIAAARDRIFSEIGRLQLWKHVGELEATGVTVIPPHVFASPEVIERAREALLDAAEQDSGARPDISSGAAQTGILSRHGQVQLVEPLIHRHPIFQDILLNSRLLAMVTYLLGESCVLFSSTGQIKGPGRHYLPLHTDQGSTGAPAPFPSIAQVCNAVLILTDYTEDNGATCFVPGSHKLCRHPTREEVTDKSLYAPMIAKAGSLLVWHGNTWHGARPGSVPGLRMGIIHYFARKYHSRGNLFSSLFKPEEIEAREPRFARLIGADTPNSMFEYDSSRASRFSQWG